MSGELFGRFYEIQIGSMLLDSFSKMDIAFDVLKTSKKEPNTATINIFNLNEQSRAIVSDKKETLVQLTAGYIEKPGVIYLGQKRSGTSYFEAPLWTSVVEAGDGEKELRFSRINKSFVEGTAVDAVLKELIKALGVKEGNLKTWFGQVQTIEGGPTFLNGTVVSGSTAEELNRIVRSAGLEWSIQDGCFQLLEAGKGLLTQAVVLNSASGLIGAPTVDADGNVTVVSLLNPDIIPGKQLLIQSRSFEGLIIAESCHYQGGTKINDWYVTVEGQEPKRPKEPEQKTGWYLK